MAERPDHVTIAGVSLSHRIHSAFARDRLGQALHEIALDAIHRSPTLDSAESEWLRAAITRPIRIATEAALGTFASELEQALVGHVSAPPRTEDEDG